MQMRVRGFSMVEAIVVGAIAAVVSATAIAITVKTSNDLENAKNRMAILDSLQRERNSHVNRAVELEVVVLCAANGAGPCTGAGGDTLVAYRAPLPAAFPNPVPANELSRTTYDGATITFTPGPALFVDAFARSTDATGVPRNCDVQLALAGGTVESIVFRADGVAVPSFDAPSAIVVTPLVSDMGSRTTPNPTPQARPNTSYRARQVFVE
jgi:type II secretory pathway pseudopilin PulG